MGKDKNKDINWFVRILLVLLALLLVIMIGYNYFYIEPKGEISSGLIIIISLLIVVILSETFDSFSVGKIISLGREKSKMNDDIKTFKGENIELRREITNIITSFSQSQSSTNIIGVNDDMIKRIFVEKASREEIEEKKQEEQEAQEEKIERNVKHKPVKKPLKLNTLKMEEMAFEKYKQKVNLQDFKLVQEAKLVTQFDGIDPISNIQPIFDYYLKTIESDIFIEIKRNNTYSIMLRYKVYTMLNKIYFFNKLRKTNGYLVLIFARLYGDEDKRSSGSIQRFLDFFAPALNLGILRICSIDFNEEETKKLYEK